MSSTHKFTINTTIAALQAEQQEEDGACVTLYPSSTKPLPAAVWDDGAITVVDANGDLFLVAEVLDFHDCYAFGGVPSFVYVALA
jgi:hypothetical protein